VPAYGRPLLQEEHILAFVDWKLPI